MFVRINQQKIQLSALIQIVLEEKKAQLAGQVVIGILSNHDQGELQGVPVAIKDIIDLVRTPATCSLITFRMLPL